MKPFDTQTKTRTGRFVFISILICLSAFGCTTHREASAPQAPGAELSPAEAYRRWNPKNASREATSDIRHNTMKIFYHGGISAFPAGVDSEDYELIDGLRYEEAGVGCVVIDAKLRRRQSEFATIYNRRIIEHLKQLKAEPNSG